MKRLILSATALVFATGMAFADNEFAPGSNAGSMINQINSNKVQPTGKNLTTLINEVNNEDQRLVDGTFDANTGTLKLYTQDMVAGNDKDISRREVVVTGFDKLKGEDGADGQDGATGATGATGAAGKDGAKGDKGDKGDTGAAGTNGTDGVDGAKGDTGATGATGAAGKDVDQTALNKRLQGMEDRAAQNDAAVAGLGGLEMRQGGEGVFSWSAGVAGVFNDGTDEGAIAAGIHYGVTDDWGVYGKVSKSFNGDAVAVFVGAEGQF